MAQDLLELKPLSREGVQGALDKAERYRLLNEPAEAESICLDVLAVDPDNQRALVTLLLAHTDQFDDELADGVRRAEEAAARLKDEYSQAYYAGIICERRGKAQLKRSNPGSGYVAYQSFHDALERYKRAEALRAPGNDDALLRWNACVRILTGHPNLRPAPEERQELPLE